MKPDTLRGEIGNFETGRFPRNGNLPIRSVSVGCSLREAVYPLLDRRENFTLFKRYRASGANEAVMCSHQKRLRFGILVKPGQRSTKHGLRIVATPTLGIRLLICS